MLELRSGRLNDPRHGTRMRGARTYADPVRDVFRLARRRAGLSEEGSALSSTAFRCPGGAQLNLL